MTFRILIFINAYHRLSKVFEIGVLLLEQAFRALADITAQAVKLVIQSSLGHNTQR